MTSTANAILAGPDASTLLDGATQLYLAIETRDGPLVTPELFTVSGDRLWMLTARSTAKGRPRRRDQRPPAFPPGQRL